MITGQFVKKGKMMDTNITSDDLALLTKWDTPTICNALEEIIPERRGYGFTTTHFFSLDSALPPICGSLQYKDLSKNRCNTALMLQPR